MTAVALDAADYLWGPRVLHRKGTYPSPRRMETSAHAVGISFGAKCGKSAIEPVTSSPGPAAHTPGTPVPMSTGFSFGIKTEASTKSVLKGEPSVMLYETAEFSTLSRTGGKKMGLNATQPVSVQQ